MEYNTLTVSIYIAKRAGQIFAFLSRSICLDIILQNSHFPVNLISHMNLILSENNVESVIVLVPGFFSILADLANPALCSVICGGYSNYRARGESTVSFWSVCAPTES